MNVFKITTKILEVSLSQNEAVLDPLIIALERIETLIDETGPSTVKSAQMNPKDETKH